MAIQVEIIGCIQTELCDMVIQCNIMETILYKLRFNMYPMGLFTITLQFANVTKAFVCCDKTNQFHAIGSDAAEVLRRNRAGAINMATI